MLALLAGIIVSFFPEAWRRRWFTGSTPNVHAGTIVSGIGQLAGCIAWLGWHFPAFARAQMNPVGSDANLHAMEKGGEAAVMGFGPILLLTYLIQPLSLLLLYFMFEGVVRIASVVVSGEELPTLPLSLLSLLDAHAREYRRERAMGPRVIDTVQREGNGDLLVASCRPKTWVAMNTIRYEEQLYELVQENRGAKPRPYLYRLRKIPAHKTVRGVYDYFPEEVLPDKERAALAGGAAKPSSSRFA